eukprot:CAMPEP_0117584180 /NCGR_PEP_ID=MMETSP0784-20121206/67448_1 /TAXON_ID=39447 /ORGANISM="" /LENGTH=81 /DNA_ID=CAMNT_0005384991 /DNA_START=11 /DNA_END=253 /DNA_ORIENTATION=+
MALAAARSLPKTCLLHFVLPLPLPFPLPFDRFEAPSTDSCFACVSGRFVPCAGGVAGAASPPVSAATMASPTGAMSRGAVA